MNESKTQKFADRPTEHIWGAPQQSPPRWTMRTTLVATGVAVLLAAASGGVIAAATGGEDDAGPLGRGFGPGGFGPRETVLHGQFVVPAGQGRYVTEQTQTGTVTAVSATALTVRSADGYQHQYAVGRNVRVDDGGASMSDVRTGKQVQVTADGSGNLATVRTGDAAAGPPGGPGAGGPGAGGPAAGGPAGGPAAGGPAAGGPAAGGPAAGGPAGGPAAGGPAAGGPAAVPDGAGGAPGGPAAP